MTDQKTPQSTLNQELQLWLDQLKDLRGRSFKAGDLESPGLIVLDLMNLFCRRDSPAFLAGFPDISENIFRLVIRLTSISLHIPLLYDIYSLMFLFFDR